MDCSLIICKISSWIFSGCSNSFSFNKKDQGIVKGLTEDLNDVNEAYLTSLIW